MKLRKCYEYDSLAVSITARKDAMLYDKSKLDFSPKTPAEAREIALAMIACSRYLRGEIDEADVKDAFELIKKKMNPKHTDALDRVVKFIDSGHVWEQFLREDRILKSE